MRKNTLKLAFAVCSFFAIQLSFSQDCQDPGTNIGDLGCVTFTYGGVATTYVTVRGADGHIWLQQNLGSSQVAESATDTEAYGDLFQWGRWDDGHQKRNSVTSNVMPSPNNPTGLGGGTPEFLTAGSDWWTAGVITDKWEHADPADVTEDNGCDPCKAMGNNWEMPTQEDWTTITQNENITNIATAFSSNLKLTVGGSRNTSGGFNFESQRGYYWSKTTTSNSNYAKYLYYSNAIVNPAAGTYRKYGNSVRCIKKFTAPTYCEVGVDWDVEPITSVVFADINNTSSEIVNGSPAYEDFTGTVGNVQAGETYDLIVKGNTVGFDHDIRAFFDWNNDGIFDMETEYLATSLPISTGVDDVEATISVQIPADAYKGEIRMRIIKDMWNVYEEGEFDACLNAYYGQIEDYTINVQENLSTDKFGKNSFNIYPNPSNGIFNLNSDFGIISTEVYNQIGQKVQTVSGNQIDIQNQPTGIYLVKILFEDGSTSTAKVVKK